MELLEDENVDLRVYAKLKEAGYAIDHIMNIAPGVDDETVLKIANDNKAILLTEDKDFGELVYRLKLIAHGIVLIRLSAWGLQDKTDRITEVLKTYLPNLSDTFTTIKPDKITMRKLG